MLNGSSGARFKKKQQMGSASTQNLPCTVGVFQSCSIYMKRNWEVRPQYMCAFSQSIECIQKCYWNLQWGQSHHPFGLFWIVEMQVCLWNCAKCFPYALCVLDSSMQIQLWQILAKMTGLNFWVQEIRCCSNLDTHGSNTKRCWEKKFHQLPQCTFGQMVPVSSIRTRKTPPSFLRYHSL